MSFKLPSFKDVGGKLKFFASNPVQASGVVARSVSQVVSGQAVSRNVITPQQQAASKFTLGDVLALPVAPVVGAGLGTITGAAASAFGEKSKTSKFIADHPVAVGGAAVAAVAAPSALYYLSGAASSLLDTLKGGGGAGGDDGKQPRPSRQVPGEPAEPQPRRKRSRKAAVPSRPRTRKGPQRSSANRRRAGGSRKKPSHRRKR